MPPIKHPIPPWLYIILALLALAPVIAVVLIAKYKLPALYSAASAAASDRTIQYRGQTIQLSKAYTDFDDYKNDPNNIAPTETSRVQQLVSSAPISPTYPTRESLFAAISQIEFPGYGVTCFAEKPQPDGAILTGFSIEIPRADRERIIVYQLKSGTFTLLDDFTGPPDISEARLQNRQLSYYDMQGKLILSRPLPSR
ncbi:MAG TPA: hypothetical protein VGQ99_18500 [Tepidisphaeraceae bacterium]|nr:hypothetical protein [Tepidisphaeraceae bacterium]